MTDKLTVENLTIGEFLEENIDGEVSVWQVMPWGLRSVSGSAVDWDWQGISANGGLSGTLKRQVKLDELAKAVAAAAGALDDVQDTWRRLGLADDAYTPETGYPFTSSLDNVAANMWAWFDAIAGDIDVREGRA